MNNENNVPILNAIVNLGGAVSMSQARRLISQGAVEFNGMQIDSFDSKIDVSKGGTLKIGKRFEAHLDIVQKD